MAKKSKKKSAKKTKGRLTTTTSGKKWSASNGSANRKSIAKNKKSECERFEKSSGRKSKDNLTTSV